jgi:N-acyl-D-amino-acid deacylase
LRILDCGLDEVATGGPDAPDKSVDTDVERQAALAKAVAFLLKSQLDDGSWHVKTRAKPVQVFFDNGDPHGKDQFISIAATGWATAALARALASDAGPVPAP